LIQRGPALLLNDRLDGLESAGVLGAGKLHFGFDDIERLERKQEKTTSKHPGNVREGKTRARERERARQTDREREREREKGDIQFFYFNFV